MLYILAKPDFDVEHSKTVHNDADVPQNFINSNMQLLNFINFFCLIDCRDLKWHAKTLLFVSNTSSHILELVKNLNLLHKMGYFEKFRSHGEPDLN